MRDALQLIEALSLERGVLQERALSDDPITGNLAETAARNDALLDRAQRSLRLAGLPDEAVTRSREILVGVRHLVAEAIRRPVTERDPGLGPEILAQLYEQLNAVQGAVAGAEREAALADARVGALVAVGSLAVEMRAAAGWRSSNLTGWLGGRTLLPSQLDQAMYMTGQVQHAWDRLQRQVLIVGNPPRLAAAIIAMREGFFRLAEPRYREYLAIARAGGARPESLSAWRRWTVEALGSTLLARDAAIAEAVDYGTAVAFLAKVHLAVAAASTVGLIALAVGAFAILLRCLVLPVQRLTAVVTRVAGGDVGTIVPYRRRRDEIGRMAAAIEVFRENALQLRQTNLRFDAALSNMPQGLAMYDAARRLVVRNRRLCKIEGVPTGSLRTGMTLREVLAVVASAGHFPGRTLDEIYAERSSLCSGDKAAVFIERRGERFVSISSCALEGGGCLFTLEDITERKQMDEALRQSRDSLTLATKSARIGIWDWDVVANKLVWDARMYELYGIQERDFSGAYDAWQASLHPDDLARGDAAIRAAIDGVKDFDIEFRVLWPNGEMHNIEAHALVQRALDGRATRMIGVNWDTTERERATETIRRQADQYATMLATTSDGFFLLDRHGNFLAANDAYCLMTGYSREELLKLMIEDVEAIESAEVARDHMQTIVTAGFDRFETKHLRKDGITIDIEGSVSFQRETGQFLCFARDITLHKQADAALQTSERKYRDLFESTRDAIMVMDASSANVLSANSSALKMFGVTDEREFLSHRPWDYSPERQPDGRMSGEKAYEMYETALREGTHLFEWVHMRADRTEFPTDVLLTKVSRGDKVLLYSTVRDISELKRADQQIAQMARYDGLTGLVNRQVFVGTLERRIARAKRDGRSFAVLYLDLDHFKDVNDTLGHPVGDELLRTVAKRLRANVRAADLVARFGGDEFAILLDDITDPVNAASVSDRVLEATSLPSALPSDVAAMAADVSEKIVTALAEPTMIEANRIHSGATVGIAVYGLDSPDAETMLKHADVALYRAKAEQRGTYRFFSAGMDAEVRARVSISAELREALSANQFFLMYQPQVDISTGHILGLEALVRWRHPTLGILGPDKFITESERNGLIVPLGSWVMREACRQAREWFDSDLAPSLIAINVSAVQFKRSLELEKDIAASVAEFALPPQLLELELTESVLMEASRDHNQLLQRLRTAGHRIAVDDFGSGYSSLDYLRRYPVDRIKIAQTFTTDIGIEPGNDAIVRAALSLARELSIEVVVEGVETLAQLELLKNWGSHIIQGYYFAKPLNVDEVTRLLRIGRIIPRHSDTAAMAAQ